MSETSPTGAAGAWSYRTGSWFAVFGPRVTVLLPDSERERVVALWSLVDGGAGFDEVLDGLLASGLSRLPGFVLVSTDEGPTRVLLRGAGVRATLTTADEEIVLDGTGGATWVERSIEGVTSLSVVVAEPAEEERYDAPAADLPILTGLVPVARVDRPPHRPAEPVAAATPEPVAAAAPEPVADTASELEDSAPEPVAAASATLDDPPSVAVAEEGPSAEPTVNPAAVAELVDDDPLLADEPALRDEAVTGGEQADGALSEEPRDDPSTELLATPEDPYSDAVASEQPASSDWVTPGDAATDVETFTPGTPEPPTPADADPAAEDAGAGEPTEAPSYAPPPPPSEPPPPLGIGSWEPVGGFPPPPPPGGDTDHDGLTVAGGGEPPPPPPGIPGQPPAPEVTPQPVAKLLISDGQTVSVDRTIVIGRAPEARRFGPDEQPQLVTVPSRLHEISSTHVEIRPGTGADHGSAVVTDMGSTNGTVLVQPGLGPEDLKPGIAVQLIPGATINLGDGITIQVTRP